MAQFPGETDEQYAAFRAYAAQDWERSIRRLAKRLGLSRARVGRWSVRYEWQKRVNAYDLQTKGHTFNRRAWRREQRKAERWGWDSRFWLQRDRDAWQRKLNARRTVLARWKTNPWLPEDLAAFERAKSRHLLWECAKYGPEVVMQRFGKRRGRKPQYLGSA